MRDIESLEGGGGGGMNNYNPPDSHTTPGQTLGGQFYPYPIGSQPTGQFFLDVTTRGVYRASDGYLFRNPEEAWAAGVARDWSNLDFIFGPFRRPDTTTPTTPATPTPKKGKTETEEPTKRLADLFAERFAPYLGGGAASEDPRTITTYSPAGGGSGGGSGMLLIIVLVLAVAGFWLFKKKGAASE